jgi:hypothetical protein
MGKRLLWRLGLAGGLLVLAAPACRRADAAGERVAVLVATAELRGTVEPCGCTSDPLGDVARLGTLAKEGLWLDAGGLLYPEGLPPATGGTDQADLKAGLLADVCKGRKAEVALGAEDLRRGKRGLLLTRHAANVKGLPLRPPTVRTVGGIRVGVFGVIDRDKARAAGLAAGDQAEAARAAVARLQRSRAEVIVALLGMERPAARKLLEEVPGIHLGVVGDEVGEGMEEPEPVGEALLVAPADQGRRAAVIRIHARPEVKMNFFAGPAGHRRRLERLNARIETLDKQLTDWAADPTADPAFLAARKAELATLKAERDDRELWIPIPPKGSYYSYELVPVRKSVPRAPDVAARAKALDRAIGALNLARARKEGPPPVDPAQPRFVGVEACQKCHKKAVETWRATRHAHAFQTLLEAGKPYDYDCTGCHVTGWQQPNGANLANVEAAGLINVQCEVCHGPGSRHVAEAGMEEPSSMQRSPDERLCADRCHTRDHSDTFQREAYLRDILGPDHGKALLEKLGAGPTAHQLRAEAKANAGH